MTHTIATIAALVAMRGEDGLWKGALVSTERWSNGVRKGGRVRNGFRLWHHAAQGGLCPTCGNPVDPFIGSDIAHVVGQGPAKRGYIASNTYLSHSSCNVGQARLSFEYGGSDHETRADVLTRIADYCAAEYSVTLTNDHGYNLILTPLDFKRADLIPMEWPCDTVGGFIRFDPAFEGKR